MGSFPSELNGGMRQLATITMVLIGHPRLLIAGEPPATLDVTTGAQNLCLKKRLQREFEMSIVFITPDLRIVDTMADQVAVMYLGCIVEPGDVDFIFHKPRHPYAKALLH